MNEDQRRLFELSNKMSKIIGDMYHPWNKILVLTKEDFQEIGTYPQFAEKYRGRINYHVCDNHKMFEFLFKRLVKEEPLFTNITPKFKDRLRKAINRSIGENNDRDLGFENSYSWTTVIDYLVYGFKISGFNPKDDLNDYLLWKKINIDEYIQQTIKQKQDLKEAEEMSNLFVKEFSSFKKSS